MNNKPEIAIIESNTLTCLGLKSILEEIIPMATIRTFHSFNELMDDTPDMYAHYFISAQIYVEHNAFFLPRKRKTIVLASDSPQFQLSGVPVLNNLRTGRKTGEKSFEASSTCTSQWLTCKMICHRLPCRRYIRKSYLSVR